MNSYLDINDYLHTLSLDVFEVKNGRKVNRFWNLRMGFDIETTTVPVRNTAYMYIWQLGINDTAFYGNTWQELRDTLEVINNFIDEQAFIYYQNKNMKTTKKGTYCRYSDSVLQEMIEEKPIMALCFIHNLSFEWQFIRNEISITDVFLKSAREPLYCKSNKIQFMDSLQITHMSLAKLAKKYTKTQKMVGDIDYSIQRNSEDGKHMTEKEYKYCENDVLILCEYAQVYFDKYLSKGEIIYTETSIVRHALKKVFKETGELNHKDIRALYPETFNEYLFLMDYLFQGGWVKSAVDVFGKVLHNLNCYDITSSYPAQITHRYYPMSKFIVIPKNNISKSLFLKCLMNKCCIIDVTFYDVEKTSVHSIISKSKIVNSDTGHIKIDNGRIDSCDKLRLVMTEMDWQIFNKFYKFDSMEINSLKIANRGKLPDYVISTMLDAYEKKESLKLQGKDYYNEKCFVNMFYGCFVTKIHKYNYTLKEFDDGHTDIVRELNDYEKNIQGSVLSPYWGIWCTSWARWQELSACWENRDYVCYGDTDSLKGKDMPSTYFDKYNEEQVKKNEEIAKKYNKNIELIRELGCWDFEGTYELFKTIGCKRYIAYDYNNKLSVTIAGVPKGTLEKEAGIEIDDKGHTTREEALKVMELLKDRQTFKDCKLTAKYNDTWNEDEVNGMIMESKSSVALVSTDFTLKVTDEYKDYIKQVINKYERDMD